MAHVFAKLDAGFHANEKVRLAGPDAREVFLYLLCRNSWLDGGGVLPLKSIDPRILADALQRPVTDVTTGVTRAIEQDLIAIDGQTVRIIGWSDEWAKRPMTDAERKAKQRHRERFVTGHEPNVTQRDCHGSEKIRSEEKRLEKTTKGGGGRSTPSYTAEETSSARTVLDRLGQRNGVVYQLGRAHLKLIAARLREGTTEMDLRAIVGYCAVELGWATDDKMRKYLRPETLFGPETIARYLDAARTWAGSLPESKPTLTVVGGDAP